MTLDEVLLENAAKLGAITEEEAERRPGEGRWSRKEILGHLIDSAANNHQRFVRAQLAPHVELPGYQQDSWVRVQAYQTASWRELVDFWLRYNRHLVHVISHVDAASREHTVSLDGRPPVTLGFLIEDYVRHLRHHLKQIL